MVSFAFLRWYRGRLTDSNREVIAGRLKPGCTTGTVELLVKVNATTSPEENSYAACHPQQFFISNRGRYLLFLALSNGGEYYLSIILVLYVVLLLLCVF